MPFVLGNLDEAFVVDGPGLADRQSALEEIMIDFEALLRILYAVETIADPFGTFDSACFQIATEAACDFFYPVVCRAEKDNRESLSRAHFSADFFKAVFEVCPYAAHKENGEVRLNSAWRSTNLSKRYVIFALT